MAPKRMPPKKMTERQILWARLANSNKAQEKLLREGRPEIAHQFAVYDVSVIERLRRLDGFGRKP
jgi:hypothetical protein